MPGIVPGVPAPAQQYQTPQPARPTLPALLAQVESPEAHSIASRHARHIISGIEQLGQVLRLPQLPGPGMMAKPVKVDEMDAIAPARQDAGVLTANVKVAEIEILVEEPPV